MSEHICELTPIDSETWDTTIGEEIVRCRDCKHAEYYKGMLWCSELGGDDSMPVEYDDFCAWGERR